MQYAYPLLDGQFIRRYKRFFADIELDGKTVVAHVPNTGSLKNICDSPRPCRISRSDNPNRKLQYTLEQVKAENSWVGVNTHIANHLAFSAFEKKLVPHWLKYSAAQREIKINSETRLDLKLSVTEALTKTTAQAKIHPPPLFVEIKSVTMTEGDVAKFPDAVTTRGQKHLTELMKLVGAGANCELLFIVQRSDCQVFSPADAIDPTYGQLLREAEKKGVKLTAYSTTLTGDRIELDTTKKLKLRLF